MAIQHLPTTFLRFHPDGSWGTVILGCQTVSAACSCRNQQSSHCDRAFILPVTTSSLVASLRTYPGSHCQQEAELGFEPRTVECQSLYFCFHGIALHRFSKELSIKGQARHTAQPCTQVVTRREVQLWFGEGVIGGLTVVWGGQEPFCLSKVLLASVRHRAQPHADAWSVFAAEWMAWRSLRGFVEKAGFELWRSLGSGMVGKSERAFRGLRDRIEHVMQMGAKDEGWKPRGRPTWRSSKGWMIPGPEHQRDWREKDEGINEWECCAVFQHELGWRYFDFSDSWRWIKLSNLIN